jgi:hypothetical protein
VASVSSTALDKVCTSFLSTSFAFILVLYLVI